MAVPMAERPGTARLLADPTWELIPLKNARDQAASLPGRSTVSVTASPAKGLDAIRENGPGVHFLANSHTLANFETAFYRSDTADNNSFEQWHEAGSLDAAQRANAIWKRMLREYEAPPIDEGIDEALLEYIVKRRASFPDSDV